MKWLTEKQVQKLKKMWTTASKDEILKVFPGSKYPSLAQRARTLGLKSEKRKDITSNAAALLNESCEAYYWLGFIMADGYFSKQNGLSVTISDRDRSHLQKLAKFLKTKIKSRNQPSAGNFKSKNGIVLLTVGDSVVIPKIREKFSLIHTNKTYNPPILPEMQREHFRTDDFPEKFDLTKNEISMRFELTDETTLEAAKRICKENGDANPFVLNFASAKNPGGGFLGGAQAQEESLARSSSLYPCLTANFEMYQYNRGRKSCLYSDWMIYSPRVPVFRNDDGSLTQKPYAVSFLTSPAVNAGVVKQSEPQNVHLIEPVNKERARKFLWIANQENHKTLILGAWGCGVFQNEPPIIARIFKGLLTGEFANCFERVVLAIYDRTPTKKVYNAFAEVFG